MSPRVFTRRLTGITAVGALGLALAAAGPAMAAGQPAANPNTDGAASDGVDTGSVLVQLSKEPLATSTAAARSGNEKVDFDNAKTKNARADLAKQRNELRQWLKKNAPKAKITGEFDVAVNAVAVQLNGTAMSVLQKAPGVVSVEYQGVYTPTTADIDPDLALINAIEGWDAADAPYVAGSDPATWAGAGIQVGVVDSGIDVNHPCFADLGFDAEVFEPEMQDSSLTNNKVIVAKVFNNKLNQNGFDATAIDSHGSHVAGTIACNLDTPAEVAGADIPYDPSGVAPGAQLGNYNVFPGDVASARSEDILNALQAAYIDGMDVINMSLGGGSHGKQDLLTRAVDNLDRAGVVVAVSAGNEGPGYMTVGSPGMAERALTAGASSVGHYVGVPIKSGETTVSVGAIGDFPVPDKDLTAPMGVVYETVLNGDDEEVDILGFACDSPDEDLDGKIALISRGGCTFSQKVANAEAKGAVGVIVVNNSAGDPSAMATDPAYLSTIPAVMAPLADRAALETLPGDVTLGADREYKRTFNDDILMDFSSWGPTDVAFRVKPDVVAPGGNVLSSIPLSYCTPEELADELGCWAFFSGTSMASPHLAGMAAVVLAAHADANDGMGWDAWQARSAIINTADEYGVVSLAADGTRTPITDVQKVGSGLAQLDVAVDATLLLSQPSVSFGAVASRSGKPLTKTIEVTSATGGSVSLDDLEIVGDHFEVSSVQMSDDDATAAVTVTFTGARSTSGFVQAQLWLDDTTHAVLFAYVK